MNNEGSAGGVVILIVATLIYFLPTLNAWSRHVENKAPTFIVNLFLGWTFIGWVVALAMSAGAKTMPKAAARSSTTLPATTKTCPECAETIQAAATVCRYCHHKFVSQPSADADLAQSVGTWKPTIEED